MQTQQLVNQTAPQSHDELILVVKREDIFATHAAWHGMQQQPVDDIMHAIKTKKEFLPRSVMELDPNFQPGQVLGDKIQR